MNYKKRISELMRERGWTPHYMATHAGINPATVTNWNTRNSTPSTEMIEKLCIAFGITMSAFFNETGEITTLTDDQKELLKQWNCLHNKEKADFLKMITTINEVKKETQ